MRNNVKPLLDNVIDNGKSGNTFAGKNKRFL